MKIIATIKFSDSLPDIKKQLMACRKEVFESDERIVIEQDVNDQYSYVDGPGDKLTKIQEIVSSADISNCFICIITPNKEIVKEIQDVAKNHSHDHNNIFDYKIVPGNYTKEIKQYKNTACKKLWNHLYIGTDHNINPCCVADIRFPLGNITKNTVEEIIDSDYAKSLRQHMIDGYQIKACKICYDREDNNIKSFREEFNATTVERMPTESLDIRLNNICNFKCRMCSDYYSSSIQNESKLIYGKNYNGFKKVKSKIERQNALQKVLPFINKYNKSIYFAGGEPLIMDEHYSILDTLIDNNLTNVKLIYNTNLSNLTYKNFDILKLWKNFKQVELGISVDASNDIAEYLRHGTIWNDLVKNINQVKKQVPHVRCKVTSTAGFLNVKNLIELQKKWIQSNYFTVDDFSVSIMHGYLNVAVLPDYHKNTLKKYIINHISFLGKTPLAEDWNYVLHYMINNDFSYLLDEFRTRMKTLDAHRQESFLKTFPEFSDLYQV